MFGFQKNVVRIQHGRNSYYFEFFNSDTINDIMKMLYKKYNFVDDGKLSIYQGQNKLDLNQKIKDLKHKNDLYINGIIENITQSTDQVIIQNEKSEEEYLIKFHEMGFIDSDDKINQLYQKNYKFEDIIVFLLKNKKILKSKF